MKIPERIRIGGVEFDVRTESGLNDGQRLLAGQIRHMDCQIAIAEESSHEYKCLTLWHEIMHGIEDQAQLELGERRERVIEAFARGVYQVLQDNGGRLFDLEKVEANVFDKEEMFPSCTVQVLTNTATGGNECGLVEKRRGKPADGMTPHGDGGWEKLEFGFVRSPSQGAGCSESRGDRRVMA